MSPFTLKASLLGAALAAPFISHAAVVSISNAASAQVYVRDCRSAGAIALGSLVPDQCEPGGVFNPGQYRDRQERTTFGGYTASTSTTSALGVAGGNVSLSNIDASGAAGVLQLRQGVFSGTSYSRVSGHSMALQSFQFTGTTGEVRTLSNVLDFTSNVTPLADLDVPAPGGSLTDAAVYAKARVTVFSLTTASFEFETATPVGPLVQSGVFADSASTAAGYRLEGEVNDLGILATGHETRLDFTMENGRYYFIESYLGLWARFGGQLDATHTFTTTLGTVENNTFTATAAGFVAASQSANPVTVITNIPAVPEPGTLAMTALGLGLLAARGRRLRRG